MRDTGFEFSDWIPAGVYPRGYGGRNDNFQDFLIQKYLLTFYYHYFIRKNTLYLIDQKTRNNID